MDAPTDLDGLGPTHDTSPRPGHRRLVIGARLALTMILIAGLVILGIGLATLVLVDPPEMDGWLRDVFGTVFGYMALGISAVLAIPSAIGVWAMAGATAEEAAPALPRGPRQVLVAMAMIVVVVTAVAVLVGGRGATLLDIGAIGLIALLTLGLAGAIAYSPHRGRALLVVAVSILVWLGSVGFVMRVFIGS